MRNEGKITTVLLIGLLVVLAILTIEFAVGFFTIEDTGLILMTLTVCLIGFGPSIFWVWMLIDCLENESFEGNDKLIWTLVIIFTSFLGAVGYFFVRRPKRLHE